MTIPLIRNPLINTQFVICGPNFDEIHNLSILETSDKNPCYELSKFYFQAAWGGGVLLSRKYRELKFKGIER